METWPLIFPDVEADFSIFGNQDALQSVSSPKRPDGSPPRTPSKSRKVGACITANGTIYIVRAKQEKNRDLVLNCTRKPAKLKKKEAKKPAESGINGAQMNESPRKFVTNGGSNSASLYTQQGRKGINQDAMLVWENFASRGDTVFCGIFDGHGPDGHLVARSVRDTLPLRLASCWQSADPRQGDGVSHKASGDPHLVTAWKESFLNAYKLMDRELLLNDNVDCVSSGTTAVTLVKQGNDLLIGNVGDSRAVLATRADDNSLLALQLTVDLKPNLPREAERIKRFKGRVFALRNEPLVKRVWLPHRNTPGLAMARALGDYCLKNFGVISEPEITYRRLTKRDQFIVVATDGVWDVLSNEQVIAIVASASVRSQAAKAIVDAAVERWKFRYPTSKVDDCAVVCLFLDNVSTASSDSVSIKVKEVSLRKKRSALSPHTRQTMSEDRTAADGVKLSSTEDRENKSRLNQ